MRAARARATGAGWVALTAVLTLVAAPPRPARAGSVRGVVAAEGYALTYGGGEQTSATFGLDVRLDGSELTDRALATHIDGELRIPVNGDLSDPSVPAYRLERLSAGLDPTQGWVALAGREWIVEVPTASVDGLTFGYRWESFRLGGFGGLEPNPYDQTFDGQFMTGGGFFSLEGEQGGAGAGFVASFYDGNADRESLTGQGRWSPLREFDAFGSLRLDLGVAGQATRLGSLAVGGDWRATPTFRLGGSFTTYRYLLRPESLDAAEIENVANPQRESIEGRARYELSHDLYTRARLSYRLRQAVPSYEVRILPEGAPLDGTAGEVYIDDQGRSYTLAATTTDESSFGGGLALGGRRLASLPLRWEVAYTGVTGFGRNDHEGALSAGFDVGDGASLDLGAGVDLRNRDETGSDVGGFARAELFWLVDRDWFALASYEATIADGDLDHALLAKVGYRIRPPAGSATAARAGEAR
ncbi:MAG: hypothetical protein IPK07_29050 [Deltaproteobacteria bacterium]|nr:hypothetical protein [Deltaproteobacteria bacterium]